MLKNTLNHLIKLFTFSLPNNLSLKIKVFFKGFKICTLIQIHKLFCVFVYTNFFAKVCVQRRGGLEKNTLCTEFVHKKFVYGGGGLEKVCVRIHKSCLTGPLTAEMVKKKKARNPNKKTLRERTIAN